MISAYLNNYFAKRMLLDYGSLVNALSWHDFRAMEGSFVDLKPVHNTITSFYGGMVQLIELVGIAIELKNWETRDIISIKVTFNIMDIPLPYNEIIGRPYLYETRGVTSILYLTI